MASETISMFAAAVCELFSDSELRAANPGERAIVARLATLLRKRFEGWSVDVEWDRLASDVKRLDTRRIVPDLVVHQVGRRDNLLVVEVKKSSNTDIQSDVRKLKGLTDQAGEYAYSVGVHLIADVVARDASGSVVYLNGQVDANLTDRLRQELFQARSASSI